MAQHLIPDLPLSNTAPDPFISPEHYQGITIRRTLAYGLDLMIIGVLALILWLTLGILTVLSFGLLWPLQAFALTLLPFVYHIFLIAGRHSATFGMRMMGLEVRNLIGPPLRPSLIQAISQVGLFYLSAGLTGFLILLVVFFNPRRRALHDYLSGTIVVKR